MSTIGRSVGGCIYREHTRGRAVGGERSIAKGTVNAEARAEENPYLEEGLVGRRRRWNLNCVELLLELGPVVVNVRHLNDYPRSRRQRGPAVVSYCHLEARNYQWI